MLKILSPLNQAPCEVGFEIDGPEFISQFYPYQLLIKLFHFCVQFCDGEMEINTMPLQVCLEE